MLQGSLHAISELVCSTLNPSVLDYLPFVYQVTTNYAVSNLIVMMHANGRLDDVIIRLS